MNKSLLISILLFLGYLNSNAQWTSNTLLNTKVRDSVGTEEATPLSATTADGKTYISYFESYSGSYRLRMQLLDPSGNKLWAPEGIVVSAFPQSSALFRYDLKVDRNSNAVVAFQDIRKIGRAHV